MKRYLMRITIVDQVLLIIQHLPDFASRRAEKTVTAAVSSSSSDEDDALSYFQKLAEE